MEGWKQSDNGTWSLTAHGQSISLPPDFYVDFEQEGSIAFTGDAPDKLMCWVIHELSPIQNIIEKELDKQECKLLGIRKVEGVKVAEMAPTTPSGRAQAGVRMNIIELTAEASLIVIGGGKSFANSFVHQWVGSNLDA